MAEDHGDSGKKGGEEKLVLTADQKQVLDAANRADQMTSLVKDLYAHVSSDYNASADLKKMGADGVLKLAQKIGAYKGLFRKARGVVGYFRYHLGSGYDAKMMREVGSYLKKMERDVKEFLYALEKNGKEIRKAGLGSLKAYMSAEAAAA